MDELVYGLRWGEPFWREMIQDGILVYERDDTSDRLSALVAGVEAECGLDKSDREWHWTRG